MPANLNRDPTPERPLKVVWYSYFPVEYLPDLPAELQGLPQLHPGTWLRVLWEEFKKNPNIRLEVIVLRNHFRRSFSFERDGTRFHCLRTPPAMRAGSLYWLDTLLIGSMLNRIRPDVTHAWGSEFGAAAVAGRLRYPSLVTMQGILTWLGSVFPLNTHLKISRLLEPKSLRRAKQVTCESSFAMNYLREHYPHLKLLQIEHAPSPVFAEIKRAPRLRPARILCSGSFVYAKGADIVIHALNGLAAIHEFELKWIGPKNSEFEQELRAQTSAALWSNLTFTGNIPAATVAEELAQAALFIHAARADNSPNSVKEAVVAGVPVVSTDTGGIRDYVIAGKNGFLFKSGEFNDCREKIAQALVHPLFSKGQVEAATLPQMRTYLSPATMAQKFYDAYLTVFRESSKRRDSR